MEIACPQCGRKFEVPEEKLRSPIKCLCKFAFRPSDTLRSHANKPASTTPPSESSLRSLEDSNRISYNTAKDQEENSVTELSDEDFGSYLTDLKTQHREMKSEEIAAKTDDTPKISIPSHEAIALDEEFEKRREKAVESKEFETISNEILEEETQVSEPNRKIESVGGRREFSQPSKPKAQIESNEINLEKLNRFSRSPIGIISIASASVFILGLSLYLILAPKKQELQKADPLLSQLLQTQTETKPSASSSSSRGTKKSQITPPAKLNEKNQSTRLARAKQKAAPEKPTASLYKTLEAEMYSGNFEKVIRLVKDPKHLKLSEKSYYFEALFLSSNRSLNQKKTALDEVTGLRKKNSDSTILLRTEALGRIVLSQKDQIKQGIAILQSLELTRPRDPFVFAYLGLAFEKVKNYKMAIGLWNQAITLNPQFSWILKKKEKSHRILGQKDKAIQAATSLSHIPGEEYEAFILLANIEMDSKKNSSAINYLKKALRYKQGWQAQFKIASLLFPQKASEALPHIQSAGSLAGNPLQKRDTDFLAGEIYCKLKDQKMASTHFYKAFQNDKNFATAVLRKAECEESFGSFENAARSYQIYLKKKPDNSEAWLHYGKALSFTKKKKAAAAALERSISIKDSFDARLELVKVYRSLGNTNQAKLHLKRAQSLKPKDVEARQLSSELQ